MFLGDLPHQNPNLVDPLAVKSDSASDNGANWYTDRMQLLSRLSSIVLPKGVRKRVGRYLIHNDVAKTEPGQGDWDDTIFDHVSSKVVNLPTYNALKVQKTLKEGWNEEVKSRNAGLERLEEFADRERAEVWEGLLPAFDRGYDLTWAYVYATDIFGHVDYRYSYPRQVAKVKDELIDPARERLGEDDELVVVSDHGMREQDGAGVHQSPGWFATTQSTDDLPRSPPDVRRWIEDQIGERSERVEQTLRNLGYID
jgi:hypothetical protein